MPSSVIPSIPSLGQYPLPAFHFSVVFTSDPTITDTSFQEVSGIGSTLATDPYYEGGENGYVVHLPTKLSHPKLVLKRGIADISSKLVSWCRDTLEDGFVNGIVPKSLNVLLLNENSVPVRVWSIENAYPVGWEIETLESLKNKVAIEKIELQYSRVSRANEVTP